MKYNKHSRSKRRLLIGSILLLLISTPIIRANDNSENFPQLYDSILHDFEQRYFSNEVLNEEDIRLVTALYKKEAVKNNRLYRARVQYLDVLIHCFDLQTHHYEHIKQVADEALQVLTKEQHPEEYARLKHLLGYTCLKFNSRYLESYQCLTEALPIFEKEKNMTFTIKTYNRLGNLWRNLKEYDNALDCLGKVVDLSREVGDERSIYYFRANVASIYSSQGDYSKSIRMLEEDIPWGEMQKDTIHLVHLYQQLGTNYKQINDLDKAYEYFEKALFFIDRQAPLLMNRKAETLFELGQVFYLKGEYDLSLKYLNDALVFIKEFNKDVLEMDTYYMLYEIYKSYGKYPLSYEYLEKSTELKKEIEAEERTQDTHNKKSLAEVIKYQEQLMISEQKAKTRQALTLALVLFMLLIFIGIVFRLINNRRKIRLKELENAHLNQQLRNEEINNRLKQVEYERQMEEKDRETATAKLLLAEKNKIYEVFLKIIEPYHRIGKIPTALLDDMKAFVNENQRIEKDWENFKIHFEKVHPSFFKKAKEISSKLTEYELHICAYIRIGMTAKQIAEMLMVNYDSVLTCRYRIRKKFELNREDSLEDFVRNI